MHVSLKHGGCHRVTVTSLGKPGGDAGMILPTSGFPAIIRRHHHHILRWHIRPVIGTEQLLHTTGLGRIFCSAKVCI